MATAVEGRGDAARTSGQAYGPLPKEGAAAGTPTAKRQRRVSQRMQEALDDGDDPDLAAFALGMHSCTAPYTSMMRWLHA